MEVIGIDLGGTAIKLGRFDEAGKIGRSISVPTPQPALPEAVLDTIVYAIEKLAPDLSEIKAIGVGTPGPVDASGRVARLAINLAGWVDIPIAGWIETATGKPTILANDGNCAGLGEAWLGAGRDYANFVLLTLGTGVGGAIIIDRQLYLGPDGCAGELGHMTIDPLGRECNSGNQGSLEQHLSVENIHRMTGKEPRELADLANAGDKEALEFWRLYGTYLGIGLSNIIYVLNPSAAIIGGGISACAEYFLPAAQQEIDRRVNPTSKGNFHLIRAKLGNTAGSIGAAKLAWNLSAHPSVVN
jgi:glucokinase